MNRAIVVAVVAVVALGGCFGGHKWVAFTTPTRPSADAKATYKKAVRTMESNGIGIETKDADAGIVTSPMKPGMAQCFRYRVEIDERSFSVNVDCSLSCKEHKPCGSLDGKLPRQNAEAAIALANQIAAP